MSDIKKWITLGALGALTVGTLAAGGSLFENLDSGDVMVIQSPISGKLTWHDKAGLKWQGLGKVTKYQKRDQFWFSSDKKEGGEENTSIPVRFNDGGKANISGSISWEFPSSEKIRTDIHEKYGSHDAVERELIRTVVVKSVYSSGTLMSSSESYAERKNELVGHVENQIVNGIYQTETIPVTVKDPITEKLKTTNRVRIVMGKNGLPKRTAVSPLSRFKILVFNPSINKIHYDKIIEVQIAQQQKSKMAVETARANAKKAEQDKITAEANGAAKAAKARWEQKVKEAIAITKAEQRKRVAQLDKQAAEFTKRKLILEGEGEAKKRRLIQVADGSLDKKLQALVQIHTQYAKEFGKQKWVPEISFGSGSTKGNSATDMINMMMAKTAKDLNLDLRAKK